MTPAIQNPSNTKDDAKQPAFPKEAIKAAIADGKALIKDGKPKIEAAMAMYAKLKGADRETVVQAFIEGAGLTEKGAVTYWYNCRRKAARIASK